MNNNLKKREIQKRKAIFWIFFFGIAMAGIGALLTFFCLNDRPAMEGKYLIENTNIFREHNVRWDSLFLLAEKVSHDEPGKAKLQVEIDHIKEWVLKKQDQLPVLKDLFDVNYKIFSHSFSQGGGECCKERDQLIEKIGNASLLLEQFNQTCIEIPKPPNPQLRNNGNESKDNQIWRLSQTVSGLEDEIEKGTSSCSANNKLIAEIKGILR